MSLPEVIGHFKGHYNASDPVLLHWMFPGKELLNGLRALDDDNACLEMCQYVTDGGVAYVFAELIKVNPDDMEEGEPNLEEQCSDREEQAERENEMTNNELKGMETPQEDNVYVQSSGVQSIVIARTSEKRNWVRNKEPVNKVVKAKKKVSQEEVSIHKEAPLHIDSNSDRDGTNTDNDYLPGDDESSEEDEEAAQIKASLKDSRRS